jgi:hypothetical protein
MPFSPATKRAKRAALRAIIDAPPGVHGEADANKFYNAEADRQIILRKNRSKRAADGDEAAKAALRRDAARATVRRVERQNVERRRDDKKLYTRDEFVTHYGGDQEWSRAEIYISKAAQAAQAAAKAAAKGSITAHGRYRCPTRPALPLIVPLAPCLFGEVDIKDEFL